MAIGLPRRARPSAASRGADPRRRRRRHLRRPRRALADTRLEPDLEDLLWSTVNLFHRAIDRIERELDDNEQAQQRRQREQDGSEIRSVELERLIAEGMTLIERRNAFELFRDQAADQFERHPAQPGAARRLDGQPSHPDRGDDRQPRLHRGQRRAETEVMLPAGPKIALTGGLDFNDHRLIWDRLDQVHAKHPDMVLLHGGSPKGAERIAACWADNARCRRSPSSPTGRSTPRQRRSSATTQMLEALPIGILVFPGTGIQDNLADKARQLGIPVWTVRWRR